MTPPAPVPELRRVKKWNGAHYQYVIARVTIGATEPPTPATSSYYFHDAPTSSPAVTPPSEEAADVELLTADSAGALVRTASQKLDELLVGQQEMQQKHTN